MFIVTDAHVSEANQNVASFFEMLEQLADTGEDVVFLGDIFDLWIGLQRYEEPMHQRFVAWCRHYAQCATVGFIEGNHEFYVVQRHAEAFSWSSAAGHDAHGVRFVHGDLVNRADKNYLRFRALTKNAVTRTLIAWMPFGKGFVAWLKDRLKTTNKAFRMGIPEQAMQAFAEHSREDNVRFVVMGHFHNPFHLQSHLAAHLWVLPAWLDGEQLSHFDPVTGALKSASWRSLLGEINARMP